MEKQGNDLLGRWNKIFENLLNRANAPTAVPPPVDIQKEVRARIERIPAFPVEQEVLKRIFADNPQLDPADLKIMRKAYDLQGPVLLEYQHPPYPNTTYIYIHKDCKDPDYLGLGRKKEPIDSPLVCFNDDCSAVLLKLGISGKFTEVHRWRAAQEKEEEKAS